MSAHTRHAMHVNSLSAYHTGQHETFSERELAILSTLKAKRWATDRDLMTALGFSDMNAVRPRITELIADGLIEEIGTTNDTTTGKRVRRIALRPMAQQQTLLFT